MKSEHALSIRLPAEVKEWLSARAKANSRSMNKELLTILKDAITPVPLKLNKPTRKATT